VPAGWLDWRLVVDSREQRAEHAARVRDLVAKLEIDGGDALAVIRGEAERLVLGCERYGALDLDAPHDWQLEEDEELVDVATYRAIKRWNARRMESRSATRKRDPEAPRLEADPIEAAKARLRAGPFQARYPEDVERAQERAVVELERFEAGLERHGRAQVEGGGDANEPGGSTLPAMETGPE
jgi:hypothetical protein